MPIDIKLPPLGDNIDSGDVLEVKVHVGDVIAREQGILEIETDKATVEVPSPHAGKVLKIHVQDGQTIPIGAPLITIEESAGAAKPVDSPRPEGGAPAGSGARGAAAPGSPPAPAHPPVAAVPPAAARPSAPAAPGGAAGPPTGGRPSAPAPRGTEPAPQAPRASAPAAPADSAAQPPARSPGVPIAAGPSVRRFAREVGVELAGVTGTGPGGRILREDVLAVVRTANEAARSKSGTVGEGGKGSGEPGERDAWGPVRSEKMPKIRKTIAAKMAESWSTAPRVTNFDDADVTELDRIRLSSREDYAADGIKLTSLPFVIKAVAMSLKRHPTINAAVDLENEQVIYKQYVHMGVAVDTDKGLVVPVLRHADRLSIPEIARQLAHLAEKVRSGNFTVDELRGSSFTVSNLGAVGGTYSTPMINVPEVAILLLGRARKMPVVVDDQIAIRLMLPLSLSYDHRLVDGAAAARFLNDVRGFLEAPSRLLLAP